MMAPAGMPAVPNFELSSGASSVQAGVSPLLVVYRDTKSSSLCGISSSIRVDPSKSVFFYFCLRVFRRRTVVRDKLNWTFVRTFPQKSKLVNRFRYSGGRATEITG
jgi:hypothetical protein